MLTIVVTTGPIGSYLHKQYSRVSGIEDRLPDLLNDLAESRRAGLTLPSALRAATRAEYGPLSPYVAKMAEQADWGAPLNEAFRQFADRTKPPLVRRCVRLVIKASRTRGSIADILKAAGKDIHDIKTIEHDRQVSTSTYRVVIYVVFMVVLSSLGVNFVPEIMAAGNDVDVPPAGITFSKIDPEELRFVYFNAATVEGLGNGMVAGVLAEGCVPAGFRHAAILTLTGWCFECFSGTDSNSKLAQPLVARITPSAADATCHVVVVPVGFAGAHALKNDA